MTGKRAAAATSVAAMGLIMAGAIGATPAAAEPECAAGMSDFDGNGMKDLAVGSPGAEVDGQQGAGQVDVVLDSPNGDLPDVTAPEPRSGDQFGATVNDMDLADEGNRDHTCSYLVVGAPGRDVAGKKDAGAIFLYAWDIDGDVFRLIKEITQESGSGAQAGARFGAALATQADGPSNGSLDRDPVLYAGAPGYDVGSSKDAGAVERLTFEMIINDLEPEVTITDTTSLTQGVEGVPGASEPGDRFGHSLVVAGESREVIIGAPGESFGGVKAAGQVTHWKLDGGSRAFHQNTAGVPGSNEVGDGFGSVLWFSTEVADENEKQEPILFVGVPHEDVGKAKNSGAVTRIGYRHDEVDGTLQLKDSKRYDQSTPGVAGTPEAGDLFGSAIECVTWDVGVAPTFVVGVPGEENGGIEGAGRVVSLGGGHSWSQQTEGIPGSDETDDAFGSTLSGLRQEALAGSDWPGKLAVGIPGEDDGRGTVLFGIPHADDDHGVILPAPDTHGPGASYGSAMGATR